jgi:Spy/CpxP family protein refolding chaperone
LEAIITHPYREITGSIANRNEKGTTMKMSKRLIASTLALGLAGTLYAAEASTSTAAPSLQATPGMTHGKHRGHQGAKKRHHPSHLQRMLKTMNKELDLSPEQKKQVKAIVAEYRQALRAKKKEMRKSRKGMGQGKGMTAAAFMNAERFDKAAFMATIQKRWEMQDARRAQWRKAHLELMADTMEKLYKVLTPEQRSKLVELSQKRRHGRHGK